MPTKKMWTLGQIKKLWDKYTNITGLRVLKDGKWKYDFSGKPIHKLDGTRAELVQLSRLMSFPKFMEMSEIWQEKSK